VQPDPTASRITYVIADDHAFVRRGIEQELDDVAGLELVGEAGTGTEACDLIRRTSPDVALVDLRLPALSGLGVVELLVAEGTTTRLVIFSAFTDPVLARQALAAGACAYLDKGSDRDVFVEAITRAAQGRTFLDPSIEAGVRASDERLLSPREMQVLQLIADGRSNNQIADALDVKLESVKTYVRRLLAKLGAESRTEVVAVALRRSLIE
jgi:two-component system nitrate/nitrite response regulator NarL